MDLTRFGENDPFFEFDNCEKVKLFDEMLKSSENRWKNITFNLDYHDSFEPPLDPLPPPPIEAPIPPSDKFVRPI